METRANYILVGGFVLVLVAGLMGFVVWLAKFQFDTVYTRYDVFFEGSVTGLKVGSPIRYSGVNVGEVIDVRLDPQDPALVRTTIEVVSGTPIKSDTVASLELEGLTGGRYVLLSGGSAQSSALTPEAGQTRAVILSRASSLEQVLEGAPELLQAASALLQRGQVLLSDQNLVQVSETLANVNRLTANLANQEERIDKLFTEAVGTMTHLRQAASSVDALAGSIEQQAAELIGQAGSTLKAAEDLAGALGETTDVVEQDVSALVADLRGSARALTGMAREIEQVVADNRVPIRDFTGTGLYDLASLVTEAREFLVGLNRVTTEVERDPARFLFGNQQQGYEAAQ